MQRGFLLPKNNENTKKKENKAASTNRAFVDLDTGSVDTSVGSTFKVKTFPDDGDGYTLSAVSSDTSDGTFNVSFKDGKAIFTHN